MKIVCYGASVTAQNEQAGYYHALKKAFINQPEIELFQVSFAASVFDQAGYGFMRAIESEIKNPDICIIDWLTPGSVSFNEKKITALSTFLLSKNCLPLWVNFPRTDDINNQRKCYKQVKNHCEQLGLPFLDVYEHPSINKLPLEDIIRDKVHTTPLGGQLYAEVIASFIKNLKIDQYEISNKKAIDFDSTHIPEIINKEFSLTAETEVNLEFSVERDLNFELYFLGEIGPYTPLLELIILNESLDHIENIKINCLDMWSHYNRKKCIKILWKKIKKGEYKLTIRSLNEHAVLDVELKKPIDKSKYPSENLLSLPINQISFNAELKKFEVKEVEKNV